MQRHAPSGKAVCRWLLNTVAADEIYAAAYLNAIVWEKYGTNSRAFT